MAQSGKAATKEIEQEETEVTEIFSFRSLFSPFSPVQNSSSAFFGAICGRQRFRQHFLFPSSFWRGGKKSPRK
jgi:hypothetical protein